MQLPPFSPQHHGYAFKRRCLFTGLVALFCLSLTGCKIFAGKPARVTINEVLLIGTLHEQHLESETYGLDELEQLLRDVNPTLVLCEIPPELYTEAWQEFVQTGQVTDEHLMHYPEFTEVLFPMALEGRIRVEPCSAWSAEVEERRQALLAQWEKSRPRDSRVVADAREKADKQLAERGLAEDPLLLHTPAYDEVIAAAMEPYERLFARDLGLGGWTQVNRAHAELINASLDRWSGDGIRIAVVFGAEHKYRLRELLSSRDDIELIELEEALAPLR